MDTSRLERFAKYARRYLMEQVEKKLIQVLAYTHGKASEQRRVSPSQVSALEAGIDRVYGIQIAEGTAKIDTKPLQSLIEKVAYIWFNRFCALRYMDVSGFNIVNVVSPLPGHFQPEILEEAKAGHIDEKMVPANYRSLVFDLLSGKKNHPAPQSEAYRILLRSVCNYYADIMPFLFEQIEDWKELLMPDDLLSGNSILSYTREAMVPGVSKNVEVIGWLYQYYISEKKDEVFANVKKGKKIQSKDIPAVTQLFTPNWIVKYMVQNSLGRLWQQSHPRSSLQDKMEYYIAQPEAEGIPPERRLVSSPEEIKFCDPCCGSGHILTYAFDLLYEIYSEEGYDPITIPRLIIENNLFGIEIDERASELAAFALAMKAREKDRQWFSRGINPQICLLQNIHFSQEELKRYSNKTGHGIFSYNYERMFSQFEDAKTFGSLIVPDEQDLEEIHSLLNAWDYDGDALLYATHKQMLKLAEQADYLSTKYQVVVTNPPYLNKGMSSELTTFLNAHYKDVKYDLFSAFVVRCSSLGLKNALIGMMNPNVWMYLSSYEKLRKWMIKEHTITNLVELPLSGFSGATVQICAYNFLNLQKSDNEGHYVRLVEFKGSDEEMAEYTKKAVSNPDCGWFYRAKTSKFEKIPGSPFAYWVSDNIRDIFASSEALGDVAEPKVGLQTGDNNQFLRQWFEVAFNHIGFGMKDRTQARNSGMKWFPYNKGGEFRKWYGNQDFVVNWENDGEEIRGFLFPDGRQRSVIRNPHFYFKKSVSWSKISSGNLAMRFFPNGFIFDVAGCSLFSESQSMDMKILGLSNTQVIREVLAVLSPTLNFEVGHISSLPYLGDVYKDTSAIADLIDKAKSDWDSYETSWDFQSLPLLDLCAEGLSLEETYAQLRKRWIENTLKMQELEEENNRIFIKAYGLQDELSPEVPLREITLTCNPYYRYKVDAEQEIATDGEREFPLLPDLENRLLTDTIKELVSYAVGCMFGRYSLDQPGLILANQGESLEDYLKIVPTPGFMPDRDNVIPILEEEWFADDIVNRFHAFLKIAFGSDLFSQNLSNIEDAIGKDIRTYFIRDFYNDHVKRYKKRPIYWLFSSPNGSFNALIYMHRYTPDTASIILSNYLREYVFKLKNKMPELSKIEESEDSTQREKIRARKSIDKIGKAISELEYWERDALFPTAAQKIRIDLDDGVKINYAKFSKVLKRIPGLE